MMSRYFYELTNLKRLLWFAAPIAVNLLLYAFMRLRTLQVFDKTNSKSLSLNSLRRMNTYIAVPLCVLTTVLNYIMMFYLLVKFTNVKFIADFIHINSALGAFAIGILLLFIRNNFISSTAEKVAAIKNPKFYFNLNNMAFYIYLYVVIILCILGQVLIGLLNLNDFLLELVIYLVYLVALVFIAKGILTETMKKQENPSYMEDCPLKEELETMAASVGRKDLSIIIVDQDKSTIGAAAACSVKHGIIFLSDTLLEKLTVEEIKAVMAHELAHLKYKDSAKRAFTFAMGIGLSYFFYEWLLEYKYWYEAETYYMLMITVCFLYFGIFSKYLSRRQEYKADAFILKMGLPYEAFKTGMLKIIQSYEVTFDHWSWEELFLTHPLLKKRFKRLARLEDK